MGIGIALATGLVQGFHQNIQEEKARRQGEQEKLDKYKELVMNASLTSKNFSQTNADMINKMIASAQGKIDSRERINIFGQQGERVDVDFTDLVSKLTSTTDEDEKTYATIGTFKFAVPEEYADQVGNVRGDVIKLDGLYADLYNNPARFKQHIADNPSELSIFRDEIPGLASSFISQRATSDKTGQITRRVDLSMVPGYDYLNQLISIDDFQQFRAEVDSLPTNSKMVDTFPSIFTGDPATTNMSGLLYVPGKMLGNNELKYVPVFQEELSGFDVENTPLALAKLAERQGEDLQYFFYNFADRLEDKDDLNKALTSITALHKIGAMDDIPSSETTINIGNYLTNTEELKDDPVLQAEIMMPFLTPLMSKAERDMVRAGIKDPNFFSSKPFNTQFEQLYGEKLSAFDERVRAMGRARTNLRKLYTNVQGTTFVGGSTMENLVKAFSSIFGETGTVDQVLSLIGVGKDDEEAGAIISSLTGGEGGEIVTISKSDTLRYIIAADLARAEDSAGRLSDGDIQRNLNKLTGFGPGTKLGELAAIETVMETLKVQERSIAVMQRVVADQSISAKDRMYMRADRRARLAREAYLDSIGGITKTQLPADQGGPMTFTKEEIFATDTENPDVKFAQRGDKYYRIEPDGAIREVDEDTALAAFNASTPAAAQSSVAQPSAGPAPDPRQGGGEGGTPLSPESQVQTAPGGMRGTAEPADAADAAMLAAGEAMLERQSKRVSALDLAGKKKTPTPDGNFMIDGVKHKRIEEGGQIFYEPVM